MCSFLACCAFLTSCMKHFQTIFSGPTLQYILNDSTPLPISLLSVDLLCSCVQIALQMENIPCEIITGLFWILEEVKGIEKESRDIMFPFCSSHCLTTLRQECLTAGIDSIAMQLLQHPVYREIQTMETILQDNDPVLFHQYEENADLPTVCKIFTAFGSQLVSQDCWLFLSSYTPMTKHVSMLLLLFPQLTIDSPLSEGESWVASLLNPM